MSVHEIESAVQKLTSAELAKFRRWFAEYDWQVWDARLEQDAKAGKLDNLGAEALEELRGGRCREL